MPYSDELRAAALELARAARWPRALSLLDAAAGDPAQTAPSTSIASPASSASPASPVLPAPTAPTASPASIALPALIALTAAEVAVESDWFAGTTLATTRLATADRHCAPSWDLDFLHLRHDYLAQLRSSGTIEFGPAGKDPQAIAQLRTQALSLADRAPDRTRHGWARMYTGLILDNLFADRESAPPHYEAALEAGGDDLLTREALRHLGDHDRDRGDLTTARTRWEQATSLGARAGLVPGTLSQQLLLATLSRDTGDDAGAHRLATEVARWSAAIGAPGLRTQAESFLSGASIA